MRAVLLVTLAACGAKAAPVQDIEQTSSAASRADVVLFDLTPGTFAPLICAHGDCAPPAPGTALRDGGGVDWVVAGTSVDDCGYEPAMIVVRATTAVAISEDEEDDHGDRLAVIPPDAELSWRAPDDVFDEVARAAVARLAGQDLGTTIAAGDIGGQGVEADLDGDRRPDRFYDVHATAEIDDEDEDWRALVFIPHGDAGAAVTLMPTQSEDDAFQVLGAFDLEGDGAYEIYFRFADDDGEQVGVVAWRDGAPEVVVWVGIC